MTDHLRKLIADRFDVHDIPDAFLYLPEELGGLSLCNPFVSYLLVRDKVIKSPEKPMQDFFELEKEMYKKAEDWFHTYGGYVKNSQGFMVLSSSERHSSSTTGKAEEEKFMSFTEYTQHRTTTSSGLRDAYEQLCRTPRNDNINVTSDVTDALYKSPKMGLSNLDSDQRWLLQLSSPELLRSFGGLSIVDKGLLPLGVMTMLRNKKVTWQEVL